MRAAADDAGQRVHGGPDPTEPDPGLDRAAEEAEGVEVFRTRSVAGAEVPEREEAQGVEVFANPDETVPRGSLRSGAPGEETLAADPAAWADEDEWGPPVEAYDWT